MEQGGATRRRWSVIASGLLVAALALVVIFTNRAAFFSPVAIVVIAAVGVMALLLQLRLRYPKRSGEIHATGWWNVAGAILALIALLVDLLHVRVAIAESLALAAVGCFGISGAMVLHNLRRNKNTQ